MDRSRGGGRGASQLVCADCCVWTEVGGGGRGASQLVCADCCVWTEVGGGGGGLVS